MWNVIKELNRYFQTLKHLRFIQFYYRLIKLIPKKTEFKESENILLRDYTNPSWFISNEHTSFNGIEFNFLNKKKVFTDMIWESKSEDPLWDYNLHYFNFLNEKLEIDKINIVFSWINNTSFGKGIGYDPYPTSLRIVNLIKWTTAKRICNSKINKSIFLQTRWLANNLEWHLLANHLFSNLKALIFSGYFFNTKESKIWLKNGKNELTKQLKEQVLLDGGHYELSPMYHNIFILDLMDLYHLNRTFIDMHDEAFESILIEAIQRMLLWSKNMTHPDKEIAFFNDSAMNIAPIVDHLEKYFSIYIKLNKNHLNDINFLRESGYIRVNKGIWSAILDVGDICPKFNPGHAHADSLSFELSVNSERLFVNSGTSLYGNSDLRLFQRGTASHNTVEINKKNSSDVWHGFRVAKRAKNLGTKIHKNEEGIKITSSHNGYKKFYSGHIHSREWNFSENLIAINDRITGKTTEAISRLYIHPDVTIIEFSETYINIQLKSKLNLKISIISDGFSIKESLYFYTFGKSIKNKCIEIKLKENKALIKLSLI
mgnify:CR=1 FL=1